MLLLCTILDGGTERIIMTDAKLMEILGAVKEEYERASSNFSKFNSAHEGLAVIEEEFEELKAEVFKRKEERSSDAMEQEAIHLAAMVIRFIRDVIYY